MYRLLFPMVPPNFSTKKRTAKQPMRAFLSIGGFSGKNHPLFYPSCWHCIAGTGSTDGQRAGDSENVEHGQDSLRQLPGFHHDADNGSGYEDHHDGDGL